MLLTVIGMLEELASAWKSMPPVQNQPANQPAARAGEQQGVFPFKQKEYPASQDFKTEKRVSA